MVFTELSAIIIWRIMGIHTHIYIIIYICIYIYMCICIYIYVYMYMYMCIYVYCRHSTRENALWTHWNGGITIIPLVEWVCKEFSQVNNSAWGTHRLSTFERECLLSQRLIQCIFWKEQRFAGKKMGTWKHFWALISFQTIQMTLKKSLDTKIIKNSSKATVESWLPSDTGHFWGISGYVLPGWCLKKFLAIGWS